MKCITYENVYGAKFSRYSGTEDSPHGKIQWQTVDLKLFYEALYYSTQPEKPHL